MNWQKIVKNTNWFSPWSREYGILRMDNFVRGLSNLSAYIGYSFSHTLSVWKNKEVYFYTDINEWKEFETAVLASFKKWQDYQKLEKKWLFHFSNFLEFSKKIPKNLKSLSNQQLTKLLSQHDKLHLLTDAPQLIIFTANELLPSIVEKIILKNGGNHKDLLLLSRPSVFNAASNLEIEILKAKVKFKDKIPKKDLSKMYNLIFWRYFWIPANDPLHNAWTFEKFLEDNEALLNQPNPEQKLKNLQEKQKKLKQDKAKLIKKLRLSQEEKAIFKIFSKFVIWKDRRDEYRGEAFAHSQPLFEEIKKRLDLKNTELQYFTIKEIKDALLGRAKLDPAKAKQRAKLSVLFCKNNKTFINEGGKVVDLLKNFTKTKNGTTNEVSGVIGSTGKTTGYGKIILSRKDLAKIAKGDILIAKTTHPDFVPAMKLCRAIVTDEGGITSHAAITARELGIPCVVGTKIATKVFKDGDIIEVNANHNWIKKVLQKEEK